MNIHCFHNIWSSAGRKYDPSPKHRSKEIGFGDFLAIFRSIFGPWVQKSSILEVGFEISMNNYIFSELEGSGGQKFGLKMEEQKTTFMI